MHPYLVELAAAERRREMFRAADRRRRVVEASDRGNQARHNGNGRGGTDRNGAGLSVARLQRRRWARRLLGYASFGFLARLGATRGGSPGIFG